MTGMIYLSIVKFTTVHLSSAKIIETVKTYFICVIMMQCLMRNVSNLTLKKFRSLIRLVNAKFSSINRNNFPTPETWRKPTLTRCTQRNFYHPPNHCRCFRSPCLISAAVSVSWKPSLWSHQVCNLYEGAFSCKINLGVHFVRRAVQTFIYPTKLACTDR